MLWKINQLNHSFFHTILTTFRNKNKEIKLSFPLKLTFCFRYTRNSIFIILMSSIYSLTYNRKILTKILRVVFTILF